VSPVVYMPAGVAVLDLSGPWPNPGIAWSIGRYDEDRAIYTQPLFGGGRSVHMGIDLGAPAGVAVHGFDAGEVIHAGVNPAEGDYGPTLVCAHVLRGRPIYVLLGHLSHASLARSPVGRRFAAGEVLGWLGDSSENGGWPPHVHVQLAWERPHTHDLPGAVRADDRVAARGLYPDPRLILGPIY
jgi:hypothetical protein